VSEANSGYEQVEALRQQAQRAQWLAVEADRRRLVGEVTFLEWLDLTLAAEAAWQTYVRASLRFQAATGAL
jgi:outer membrane protein TolC